MVLEISVDDYCRGGFNGKETYETMCQLKDSQDRKRNVITQAQKDKKRQDREYADAIINGKRGYWDNWGTNPAVDPMYREILKVAENRITITEHDIRLMVIECIKILKARRLNQLRG